MRQTASNTYWQVRYWTDSSISYAVKVAKCQVQIVSNQIQRQVVDYSEVIEHHDEA